MLFLLLAFLLAIRGAPVHRVAVSDTYNVTTSDDVIGCLTNASQVNINIMINLFSASTGNYVVCITDENGHSNLNNVQINADGTDLFVPEPTNQYVLSSPYQTSCFYSDGGSLWHERIFQLVTE
jgi:hypothetical protein